MYNMTDSGVVSGMSQEVKLNLSFYTIPLPTYQSPPKLLSHHLGHAVWTGGYGWTPAQSDLSVTHRDILFSATEARPIRLV